MAINPAGLGLSVQPCPNSASEVGKTSGADSFALGHLPNNGKILDVKKEHSPLTKGSLFEAITNGIGQALNGHLSKIREAVVSEMRHQANWEQFKVKQLEAKFDTITKDFSDRIAIIAKLEKKVAELEQKLAEAGQNSVPKASEEVPPPPPEGFEGLYTPPSSEHDSKDVKQAEQSKNVNNISKVEPVTTNLPTDPEEKLKVIMDDLKNIGWEKTLNKYNENDIRKPSGAGHGDVIFILDTKYVVKKVLSEEYYSLQKTLNQPQAEDSSPSIIARRPYNVFMGASEGGKNGHQGYAVLHNIAMTDDHKSIGAEVKIVDTKVGSGVSIGEQIYNGYMSEDPSTASIAYKKLKVQYNHSLKEGRHCAIVEKGKFTLPDDEAQALSKSGREAAHKTPEIIHEIVSWMSKKQTEHLIKLYEQALEEAKNADVVFVGSSLLSAIPFDGRSMPAVMRADDAHPVYKKDISDDPKVVNSKYGALKGRISQKKYDKIRDDYLAGLQDNLDLYRQEYDKIHKNTHYS